MKKSIFISLALGVSSLIYAQNRVKGVVIDQLGEPLMGANLVWVGSSIGGTTDIDGRFSIEKSSKENRLAISYVGYDSDTLVVNSTNEEITIEMKNNASLGEVVVRGQGMGTLNSRVELLNVQKMGVAEFQRAACCNLSEAFETNASVDVNYSDAATGAKTIKLLGLSNHYVQMLTENVPNLRGIGSLYGMDWIPGPWMESIQISKGAASVKNGYESITGQINVEYKKPDKSDPLTINLFGMDNGRMEGNVDGNIKINEYLSTGVMAHYSNDKFNHDANNDKFLDRPRLEQANILNRWLFKKNNYHSETALKYIYETRNSGQAEDHSMSDQKSMDTPYTINMRTHRGEIFSKNGLILDADKQQSIALILSGNIHDFKSNYGINRYDARQSSIYASLMYESSFGVKHNISSGISFVGDFLSQNTIIPSVSSILSPNRNEFTPGAYAQYTYKPTRNLTLMAGIRLDHHNEYGLFFTPRANVKWDATEWLQIRATAGKGYRSVNIWAENSNLLASSRVKNISIAENLNMEEAWNSGISATAHMPLFGKELSVALDYYRTDFINQVIIDNESAANAISFYNLDGKSFANSIQLEVGYPIFNGFDLRAAYRLNDTKVTYNGVLKEKALQSRHKGLVTASYQTPNPITKWQFDYTLQINGSGRMPTPDLDAPLWNDRFDSFTISNVQVSKFFKNWSIYIGVENLFNFTQDNPIIDAANPYGDKFDATIVYGPVHGRSIYGGVRWNMTR
ncbi:MAG: TonB-dependent receptor [Bacteroidales bacterium]